MRLITLNDVADSSAQAVQEKLQSPGYEHINDARVIAGDVSELAILGHTGEGAQTLGDMSARQFAKELAKKYAPEVRGQVQHIYLIGCEAGLSINGQPALAQQIAHELHEEGFANVKVHAISNPVDVPIRGMQVEVVHHVGLGAKYGEERGKLRAHLHVTDEQERIAQEISELEEAQGRAEDRLDRYRIGNEINGLKDQPAYQDRPVITETDDLLAELRRPQNTFNTDGLEQEKVIGQEKLIQAVEKRIWAIGQSGEISRKKKGKLLGNFEPLLQDLRAAGPNDWANQVVRRMDQKLAEKKDKHKKAMKSTFYQHLFGFDEEFNLRAIAAGGNRVIAAHRSLTDADVQAASQVAAAVVAAQENKPKGSKGRKDRKVHDGEVARAAEEARAVRAEEEVSDSQQATGVLDTTKDMLNDKTLSPAFKIAVGVAIVGALILLIGLSLLIPPVAAAIGASAAVAKGLIGGGAALTGIAAATAAVLKYKQDYNKSASDSSMDTFTEQGEGSVSVSPLT